MSPGSSLRLLLQPLRSSCLSFPRLVRLGIDQYVIVKSEITLISADAIKAMLEAKMTPTKLDDAQIDGIDLSAYDDFLSLEKVQI